MRSFYRSAALAITAIVGLVAAAPSYATDTILNATYILSPPASGVVPSQVSSPDGRFTLKFQNDGNLVWSQGSTVLWDAHVWLTVPTGGYSVYQTRFQTDGNLVVYWYYAGSETPVWSSKTYGNPGATLHLQNDGNLVIYNAAGKAIWSSKTCCH